MTKPNIYDRGTQRFHWLSALLILAMIPIGFIMQDADGATKLLLYRLHCGIGLLLLAMTVVRILWRFKQPTPAPPAGMGKLHVRGLEATHVLLYVILLALTVSGVAMLALSDLPQVLSGASSDYPDLAELGPRKAHGAGAFTYIALLIAHVGGVVLHQVSHGGSFHRIGVGKP
jgi:cytochrome b561